MRHLVLAVVMGLLAINGGKACTFCGGGPQSRSTLRQHFAESTLVVRGRLANPRLDPATGAGATDFHVIAALKADASLNVPKLLTVPQYFPTEGNAPSEYILFGALRENTIEPAHSVPATAAVLEYLQAVIRLDDKDAVRRLAFCFKHLDAKDPMIAADAFAEFARASDAEIMAAAAFYDPAKLRTLLADPAGPVERLGVLAFLLGTCGGPADAAFLGAMVKQQPMPERLSSAIGGLLAGYVLLAPREGWDVVRAALGDVRRPFSERLSALGAVRFFQMTRPNETKAEVLRSCAMLLAHGDLADQAIEDLRRWGWWDLTGDVLVQWGKPTHAAPIVRRALIRYALTCPKPEARGFVIAMRQAEPKLVASVEDSLSRYAPRK